MVRRLITIAAPHRGTPWADTPDRSGLITTMYNVILSSPFYGDHPGWEYVLKPFTFMIHTMFPSPQIFQDAYLAMGSAWSEFRTTEPRSYSFLAKVPMFAIA
jgi:hypothetical protein